MAIAAVILAEPKIRPTQSVGAPVGGVPHRLGEAGQADDLALQQQLGYLEMHLIAERALARDTQQFGRTLISVVQRGEPSSHMILSR